MSILFSKPGDALNKEKRKVLLIIDGNSLAHRCIYAHNELGFRDENNNFVYTGLSYGFVTNILMLNEKFNPHSIIVVWDGGCNYRRSLYPGYKLKRHTKKNKENKANIQEFDKAQITHEKPPHIFSEEIKQLKEIMQFLPVQHCILPGEEADDVIGILSRKLHKKYDKTFICSTDHDFMQLLKYKNVLLYRSYGNKEEIISSKTFRTEYNLEPKYYPNVLAIGGDTTDEYKGVVGISEKTAFEIVKTYGPKIKDILKHSEDIHKEKKFPLNHINKRHAKLITEQKDQIFLCKKLAQIRTDISGEEIKFTVGKLLLKSLQKKFKQYKFHSFMFDEKIALIKKLPKNFIELS